MVTVTPAGIVVPMPERGTPPLCFVADALREFDAFHRDALRRVAGSLGIATTQPAARACDA